MVAHLAKRTSMKHNWGHLCWFRRNPCKRNTHQCSMKNKLLLHIGRWAVGVALDQTQSEYPRTAATPEVSARSHTGNQSRNHQREPMAHAPCRQCCMEPGGNRKHPQLADRTVCQCRCKNCLDCGLRIHRKLESGFLSTETHGETCPNPSAWQKSWCGWMCLRQAGATGGPRQNAMASVGSTLQSNPYCHR